MTDNKIRGIVESAVEAAFIDFPNVRGGRTWPQDYKETAECKTLAMRQCDQNSEHLRLILSYWQLLSAT